MCSAPPISRRLEVCIDNFDSALKAAQGGAHRLEVCSSLAEGGLTPSLGLVSLIKEEIPYIKLYVMIRCKAGSDFVFSDADVRVMLSDIEAFKKIKVDGFVFGALGRDGSIDIEACKRIVGAARPAPVTFHRAFDVCSEQPAEALEMIIELGFCRLLTSGRQTCAASDEARVLLMRLIVQANGRLIVMPGSGINPGNVRSLLELPVEEVHASCSSVVRESEEVGVMRAGVVYEVNRSRVKAIVKMLEPSESFVW